MKDKDKASEIVKILIKRYGRKIPVYLHYDKKKPYEFLFAVIMSAQCTDKRVNEVTAELYKKYKDLKSIAKARLYTFEKDIHSVGFYHNKAKSIIRCANVLLSEYNSKIPKTFDEILSLPGVGRKTASVVIGELYDIPAMAVDTHVARVSNLLFNLGTKDPKKIEGRLKDIIDKRYWNMWNTHIIAFGREICTARRPKCEVCPFKKYCKRKN